MKHVFVLDENVIAQVRRAALALQTVRLTNAIKLNCHRVAVDRALSKKLFEWIEQRSKLFSRFFPSGPREIRYVLSHATKKLFVVSQEAAERKLIRDPDDWFLVDLTVSLLDTLQAEGQSGRTVLFVSSDSETRECFSRKEFSERGLKAVPIEEALKYAQEQ